MQFTISTGLCKDLGFALRQLRRSPGFATTAVLILALGIAANVIVFGVLQPVILQPVNLPHAEQVMTFAPHEGGYPEAAYPEVRDVRDNNSVFSAVAAEQMRIFGLEANGATRPIWGEEVSRQYFEVMAIKPFLGRLLRRSDDDHPGASEAAVLSWPEGKSSFGADPNNVGKTVRLNKHTYTIVGVTPEGFYGTQKFLQPNILVPMANEASLDGVNWLEDRLNKTVFRTVRIKDGVNVGQAQAQLDMIAARIRSQDPEEADKLAFKLTPPGLIGDFVRRPARRFLTGVMALADILLMAACTNLGSLFAARTAGRTREIAIRLGLGSSRRRIFRQVLVEVTLISLVGGMCAFGLSWVSLSGLARCHPPTDYSIKFPVEPQPSLLLIAFLLSLVAGLRKDFTLSENPQEAAFFPILQQPSTATSLIVRTRVDAANAASDQMAASIRKLVRDLDPAIPIRVSTPWYNALAFTLFPSQVATAALGLFGAFRLLLSIAGTFGLAAYTVSKRLRELSIRVALGAEAKEIVSTALGRMMILLTAGSLVGLALGIGASRLLVAIVFQASAQDPFVLVAAALTMILAALLSVVGPVRRALHMDSARLVREQ